jgi:hypothetical protein
MPRFIVNCCRGNSESLVLLVSKRCGQAEIVNSQLFEIAIVFVGFDHVAPAES